jgi:hypothetical protein
VRGAVFAVIAIKRMSKFSRAWLSEDSILEEKSFLIHPDASLMINTTLPESECEVDDCMLSRLLIQRLEALARSSVDSNVQKALDVLDRVCAHNQDTDPS